MTRPQRPPRNRRLGLVIAALGLAVASCSGRADPAAVVVTVDGQGRSDRWMLWVGGVDGSLTLLCAVGPDTEVWPPR